MANTNLPSNRDDARTARLILMGPLGNFIFERCTKTDFDRQAENILEMKRNGMEHGHAKMSSNHGGKIHTDICDASYTQQNDGDYTW